MLGRSEILHVAGWATMLLVGHQMWASSEPPMVAVDKDKPCSQVGDVDYAFLRGLLGTSARLLLVIPSALAVCNVSQQWATICDHQLPLCLGMALPRNVHLI
jgi:hypothetical protein